MRRVPAGLGGLALATGVAATVALSAAAAPPDGSRGASARHNGHRRVPDAAEQKRRALRKAGLQQVLNGTAKVEQRGASKVVKVGQTAAPGRRQGEGRDRGPVRRARPREDRQDLRGPGRVRQRAAPGLPGPGHRPGHPGPGPVRRPAAQRDPGAGPLEGQPHDLAGRLLPRALPAALLRHGRERRVAQDLLRAAVVGPLQRRRHGHRLGQGPLQRGALRPQRRLPVRRPTSAATPGR